ncbi:probable pyruvate dehydrogenase E1 component subunit alpha, mitochondrial [Belonocnema kinseyi]|uniref:probable pyruvate dehydrogenase E1 component subunit alpha, mitochondrial n=1 Tax=Belonocnema kinseyi TaxID=2817044 RepID=UPI00143D5BF5|nr:probable pyruvate dehydrogenase E1 component subunit alpha, mitochondrial [Belonocnema kinseyi]
MISTIRTLSKTFKKDLFCFKKKTYSTEATFETQPFRLHKLEKGPDTTSKLTKEDALIYYKKLLTIRRMENACSTLYKEKVIRGFCHLYSGQEAVAVGMIASLRKDKDTVVTSYRAHGWAYLMGIPVLEVIAELTGRKTGNVRGKGGSMHMYTTNFFGGNGIVGGQVPLGGGLGFTHKYRKDGGVCACLYGDGAANQGQLFEIYNISQLWKLPIIFICENNGYGMGTSAERAAASTEYYTRGDYVPGVWVDGMDFFSVREATKFAIEHCSSGKGPIVMEVATYRYFGHSMSDPGTSYRSRDEVKKVRETRDPIAGFKEKIIKANLVSPDDLKKIDDKVKNEIEEAVQKSKTDPEVPEKELTFDIYSNCLEPEIRNNHSFSPLKHERLGKLLVQQ